VSCLIAHKMSYLNWDEKIIIDFSEENIAAMYADGYVFTRIGKGVMQQTRSLRINLENFFPTSENRRILRKTEGISLESVTIPYKSYSFEIGKMAKDFYDNKFGVGTMSVQKIKEMMTSPDKSNFNCVFRYSAKPSEDVSRLSAVGQRQSGDIFIRLGYAICYASNSIIHYSYPFYDLDSAPKDMGLGMMIRAIQHAKGLDIKYVYLGSLQRPSDVYKLQFESMEWFDGKEWKNDLEEAKKILKK